MQPPTRLLPDLFAVESALFVEELGLVVICDLQLGREGELRNQGVLVLDRELRSMKRRLQRILRQTQAKRLLINGDLKHEFARINQQEWSQILNLFDFFKEQGVDIILVKGNHDTMLGPIAKKRDYELRDHYFEDGLYFCHGHEVPDDEDIKLAKTIIIGHEHPAVRFDDGVRKETAKCFLVGKWRKKNLVVLPSFCESTIGTDILDSALLSPFIEKREKMAAFVLVEDSILRFGTVKDIRSALKSHLL